MVPVADLDARDGRAAADGRLPRVVRAPWGRVDRVRPPRRRGGRLAGQELILTTAFVTVGLSVFAHGVSAAPLAARYADWLDAHPPSERVESVERAARSCAGACAARRASGRMIEVSRAKPAGSPSGRSSSTAPRRASSTRSAGSASSRSTPSRRSRRRSSSCSGVGSGRTTSPSSTGSSGSRRSSSSGTRTSGRSRISARRARMRRRRGKYSFEREGTRVPAGERALPSASSCATSSENGPLLARELEDIAGAPRVPRLDGGRAVTEMLEILHARGVVAIVGRARRSAALGPRRALVPGDRDRPAPRGRPALASSASARSACGSRGRLGGAPGGDRRPVPTASRSSPRSTGSSTTATARRRSSTSATGSRCTCRRRSASTATTCSRSSSATGSSGASSRASTAGRGRSRCSAPGATPRARTRRSRASRSVARRRAVERVTA